MNIQSKMQKSHGVGISHFLWYLTEESDLYYWYHCAADIFTLSLTELWCNAPSIFLRIFNPIGASVSNKSTIIYHKLEGGRGECWPPPEKPYRVITKYISHYYLVSLSFLKIYILFTFSQKRGAIRDNCPNRLPAVIASFHYPQI